MTKVKYCPFCGSINVEELTKPETPIREFQCKQCKKTFTLE